MAHIQRLYDFQAGTKIISGQVDAEFNQLISYVNGLDDIPAVLAGATGATKVGVGEGGNLQTLLDKLVRFATANIKHIRLNADKVIETSANGVDWEASGSSGHLIQRANGTILPQRSRLQFTNTTITDDGANNRTVIQGVVGPTGPQGVQGPVGPVGEQGIQGLPGADGQGKMAARFVVGTSTAGWTTADCDYLCDGTADQTEINDAITALPATGGEIVILDGTYKIAAKIDVTKDNVSIRGNGNATTLKRMFNSSSSREGVITLTNRSGCKIANLRIDGGRPSYAGSDNYGIYLRDSSNNTVTSNTCTNNNYGIYLIASSNNNTVTGNTCNSNGSHGIYLFTSSNNTVTSNTCTNNNYGIYLLSSSNNNTVTGNTCNSNSAYGIYLTSSSKNNTITGNTCNNNPYGIYLTSSSKNNTITGNTCNDSSNSGICLSTSSNTVTGNTCTYNNNYGIYLRDSSSSNTITGNTCGNNGDSGIYLIASSNNTITGNTCNNNTYGIYLLSSSKNNTITGNTCNDSSNSGIYLTTSSNNTITGNTCIRGTGLAEDYAESQCTIQLVGTGNSYNLISNNNCMGKAVTNEGGTGNTLVNNKFDAT